MSWKSVLAAIAALGLALPAMADWDPWEDFKWLQEPDMMPWSGIDIAVANLTGPPGLAGTVADDFKCTGTGYITDIHLWMSYLNDAIVIDPMMLTFQLGIWSDIPAGTGGLSYSRPGVPLWDGFMTPTSVRPYGPPITVPGPPGGPNLLPAEHWWNPVSGLQGFDSQVWQFNFDPIEDPFWQREGTIYWLSVSVLGEYDATIGGYKYDDHIGWKTSIDLPDSDTDDAVYFDGDLPWTPLVYPDWHQYAGQSIDMAFVITPEPSQYALVVGLGLVAFAGCRRFRAR